MTTTISSQRYLDDTIVDSKRAAQDYKVDYVDVTVEGIDYRVIVDGHHSLAAAREDGAAIDWRHNETLQQEADSMGGLAYLDAHWAGDDWYNVETGANEW